MAAVAHNVAGNRQSREVHLVDSSRKLGDYTDPVVCTCALPLLVTSPPAVVPPESKSLHVRVFSFGNAACVTGQVISWMEILLFYF